MTSQLTTEHTFSADLLKVCMTFVQRSAWRMSRFLASGSYAEIPLGYYVGQIFDIKNETLDFDVMFGVTVVNAIPRSAKLPDSYSGQIFRIYTDNVHPG